MEPGMTLNLNHQYPRHDELERLFELVPEN